MERRNFLLSLIALPAIVGMLAKDNDCVNPIPDIPVGIRYGCQPSDKFYRDIAPYEEGGIGDPKRFLSYEYIRPEHIHPYPTEPEWIKEIRRLPKIDTREYVSVNRLDKCQ